MSPTARCFELAVVVSISSWPSASVDDEPDVMLRITVSDRSRVETAVRFCSDPFTSNWSW